MSESEFCERCGYRFNEWSEVVPVYEYGTKKQTGWAHLDANICEEE